MSWRSSVVGMVTDVEFKTMRDTQNLDTQRNELKCRWQRHRFGRIVPCRNPSFGRIQVKDHAGRPKLSFASSARCGVMRSRVTSRRARWRFWPTHGLFQHLLLDSVIRSDHRSARCACLHLSAFNNAFRPPLCRSTKTIVDGVNGYYASQCKTS
jgi:hypothetical protein